MGELVVKAERKGVRIHFPTDFITADKFSKDANVCMPTNDADVIMATVRVSDCQCLTHMLIYTLANSSIPVYGVAVD